MNALLHEITRLRELARHHAKAARRLRKDRDRWRQRARAAEWANRTRKEHT